MNPPESPPPAPGARPSRSSRGLAWLACVLAVLALAGAVYLGWQQRLTQRSDQRLDSSLQSRLDDVGARVEQLRSAGGEVQQGLTRIDQRSLASADQIEGLEQRMRTLESAVARISEKTLSAHDSLVLDQVEALLLTGQQRAELFHDPAGALTAYRLARDALTPLGNPQLDGGRTLLRQELEALLKNQPQASQAALDTLASLRAAIPGLALKPADSSPAITASGLWGRIWAALSHVVSIQKDAAGATVEQQATLARQLAELDVVEAQAALLADDLSGYQQALQQLSQALARQFDPNQGEVSQARASVALLLSKAGHWTVPELGGALAALRDLRRESAPAPAPASSAPAHPASAPAPAASTPAASTSLGPRPQP